MDLFESVLSEWEQTSSELVLCRMHSFGVIRIRISDPRFLRSWCIKGTNESTLVTDLSASLMHQDLSNLGLFHDPDPDHPNGMQP